MTTPRAAGGSRLRAATETRAERASQRSTRPAPDVDVAGFFGAAGNQAALRSLRDHAARPTKAPVIQRKRKASDHADAYEREADQVAEEIARAPNAAETAPAVSADPRAEMSTRLGYDFRHVRLHTGPDAQDGAAHLGANAFAIGGDVYFGAGRYAPSTAEGRRLIAHELTHVAQQGAAPSLAAPPAAARPGSHAMISRRAPRSIQRDIAEDKLPQTPVETIMADSMWFENDVKNVAYYTGELAILQYNDGSEIRVGLVPEWIEAPFEAIDFKTARHVHIPVTPPDVAQKGSLGTGSIRFIPLGAELTNVPRGATFGDIIKSDEITRTIRFTHHKNGRIVPTEINTISAPRLCAALRTAEAEFIKRMNEVAAATVEVLEKLEIIVTLGSVAGGLAQAGRAAGGRVLRHSASATAARTAIRATARAEGALTKVFGGLLKSGQTTAVTVEGVGFGGVKATMSGTELVVARTTIVNVSKVPAQGRFVHAAFERAAIETARQAGAKTARVALHTVQNPKWAAYLEAQGYTFEVIQSGATTWSRVLTKVWVL